MKKALSFSLMALAFLLFQACNNGGKGSKQEADSINRAHQPMPEDASEFMVDAAMINLSEIALGDIAQTEATSPRVKQFASMIVSDHQSASSKLKNLAREKNVALPDSLDQQHKSDVANLRDQEGSDFDQAFVKDMVDGHKDAIDRYQKAIDEVENTDVQSYISGVLPVLHKHLDSAKAIQQDMKNSNPVTR